MSLFPAGFRFEDVPSIPAIRTRSTERIPAPQSRLGLAQEKQHYDSPGRVYSSPGSTSSPFLGDTPSSDLIGTCYRRCKVMIAESEDLCADAVSEICRNEFGHFIAGRARDGGGAINTVGVVLPDLLILDLNLAVHHGFEVASVARHFCPKIKIIVFTAARGRYTFYQIERFGFDAYVDKNSRGADSLRAALHEVGAGRRYFAPSLLKQKQLRFADPTSFDKLLTEREKEVLGLVGQCLSNAEIGAFLGISEKTAETFRHRLLKKLSVAGTPKLIRFATEHGFTQFAQNTRTGKRVVAGASPHHQSKSSSDWYQST